MCDTAYRCWTPLATEGFVSTATQPLPPNMQTRDKLHAGALDIDRKCTYRGSMSGN